jgi:N-acetylglucosaminyl-diphospho-decaprenol L-rhamnosyltransferase
MLEQQDGEGAYPWVRVVIVNYNAGPMIQACVDALAQQTFVGFEAVIVDNASTDGSAEALRLPDERFALIRNDGNAGFAAANNIGVRGARAPWIATLNPDTIASADWLEEMRRGAQAYPGVCMLGATLVNATNPSIIDGFGDALSIAGIAWRGGTGRPVKLLPSHDAEVFAPCAAAALYDRAAFDRAGGFDAAFFCYLEDVDLGFRLRLAGERCVQLRNAIVRHHASAIAGEQSDFVLYHSYRNRLWLIIKSMPLPLAVVAVPLNLVGSALMLAKRALSGKSLCEPLRGLAHGLMPGAVLDSRRKIHAGRKISAMAVARSLVWNPLQWRRRPIATARPHSTRR